MLAQSLLGSHECFLAAHPFDSVIELYFLVLLFPGKNAGTGRILKVRCDAALRHHGNPKCITCLTSSSTSLKAFLLRHRWPLFADYSFLITQPCCLDYNSIHLPGVLITDYPLTASTRTNPNQLNLSHEWQRTPCARSHAFHKLVTGVLFQKYRKSQRITSIDPSRLFGQPMLR